MDVSAWLARAIADADARGLPELEAAARDARALHAGAARRRRRVPPPGREHAIADRDHRTMTTRPIACASGRGSIERREISPVELTRACLDRIAAGNDDAPRLHHRDWRSARWPRRRGPSGASPPGSYRGPLHGIPVSVKDLVDVAGTPTTSGSRVPPRRPGSRRAGRRRTCCAPAPSSSARPTCTSSRSARRATRRRSARCAIRTIASRSAGGSSAGAAVALRRRHVLRIGRHRHRRLDPDPGRRLRHHRA